MEPASDISSDIRSYFLASNHSAVQQSLLSMPPPSFWEFNTEEAVRFVDFDGTWCTSEGQYRFGIPAGQTEGIIDYVGSSYCEVNIPLQGSDFAVNSHHMLLKVNLEKIFSPGDAVLLLSGARQRLARHSKKDGLETPVGIEDLNQEGNEGLVISVGPAKVEVLLQDNHNDSTLFLDFHPNTLTKVNRSVPNHGGLRHRPEDHLTAKEPFTQAGQHAQCPMKPFTGEVPWKNLQVYPMKYSNKGYRATVADAPLDSGNVSGLSIQSRYEAAQGMNNALAWFDYDCLRRVDNDRSLPNDIEGLSAAHSHINRYWNPKRGYSPEYSADELRLFKGARLPEEHTPATESTSDVVSTETLIRSTTPCYSLLSTATDPDLDPAWDPSSPSLLSTATDPDLDPAWDPSSPDPPTQHWILDPRIIKGVPQGLELLVATTTDSKRDRRVFFQTTNGITEVFSVVGSRMGRKKPGSDDIVKVNPSTILDNPRSFSVPYGKPGIAKGLYLICSGNYTGVLCRRISHMIRLDSSKPSRWLVQAVKLIRKPVFRLQFEEIPDPAIGTCWVEGKDLVAIHETTAMRTMGNKQWEPIRCLYQPFHEL
ncbi:hypothetical protein EV361DRAFT_967168 [Lentinula raphanica]|nr:hypothetical protein EV361DRAFT_967168 [Lentinula raphanica]